MLEELARGAGLTLDEYLRLPGAWKVLDALHRGVVIAFWRGRVVVRPRPRFRSPYVHATWAYMAALARLASRLSTEEVARLCGCRVYDPSRSLLECDGQIMNKVAAYVRCHMRGRRFRPPVPDAWRAFTARLLSGVRQLW